MKKFTKIIGSKKGRQKRFKKLRKKKGIRIGEQKKGTTKTGTNKEEKKEGEEKEEKEEE